VVANLVKALASFRDAKSVVGLSNSPVFHQFSSISKAIAGLAKTHQKLKLIRKLFRRHRLKYFHVSARNYFQTDVVNLFREHSPCLKGRQYRHRANNVIAGNQPLGIGFGFSFVNLADFPSSWSLPYSVQRVGEQDDEIEVAVEQIGRVCESEEFVESLQINAADSSYGVAKYISQVNGINNLVNIIRLRHGNKVFASEYLETKGAPQIYGRQYYT
jgi:hypothetical protein